MECSKDEPVCLEEDTGGRKRLRLAPGDAGEARRSRKERMNGVWRMTRTGPNKRLQGVPTVKELPSICCRDFSAANDQVLPVLMLRGENL